MLSKEEKLAVWSIWPAYLPNLLKMLLGSIQFSKGLQTYNYDILAPFLSCIENIFDCK